MTIFVDPYHTPIGMAFDTRKVVKELEQSAVRESLHDTNLGVRSENGITPVFVTGCRDSESGIPPFTHPISVKISNGSEYLFTDMRLFIRAGTQLYNLSQGIRRMEEFEFTKYRAIASLAWAAGDRGRFQMAMQFGGSVFSAWIAQAIGRTERLAPTDQMKIQLVALAYYFSLFNPGAVDYKEDDGMRLSVSTYASDVMPNMSKTSADAILKTLNPMSSFNDMCGQISETIQSSLLKGLDSRTVLNLLANGWFATNGAEILKVAMEHPPTWVSILYFCIAYNNYSKTMIGQTIQAQGRGGKSEGFKQAYKAMVDEYCTPMGTLRSVFEYRRPDAFIGNHLD